MRPGKWTQRPATATAPEIHPFFDVGYIFISDATRKMDPPTGRGGCALQFCSFSKLPSTLDSRARPKMGPPTGNPYVILQLVPVFDVFNYFNFRMWHIMGPPTSNRQAHRCFFPFLRELSSIFEIRIRPKTARYTYVPEEKLVFQWMSGDVWPLVELFASATLRKREIKTQSAANIEGDPNELRHEGTMGSANRQNRQKSGGPCASGSTNLTPNRITRGMNEQEEKKWENLDK